MRKLLTNNYHKHHQNYKIQRERVEKGGIENTKGSDRQLASYKLS